MRRIQPVPLRRGGRHRSPGRARARGFTLMSVLVAAVVAAFGVLAVIRLFGTVAASNTQNQNISQVASLGNGFWGVVQANPAMLAQSSFTAGPFTASNYGNAPAALQPWLLQATGWLPNASVAIATSNDAGFASACSATGGCTVTMTLSWTQVSDAGIGASTRSQTFYYQFGL